MAIVWKKRTLDGRAYWVATRGGFALSGVPMVHASRHRPGAYYVGVFDADHHSTLADAKRAAGPPVRRIPRRLAIPR